MKVLILDSHPIYRRGVAACLAALPDVGEVAEGGSVRDAGAAEGMGAADVVLIDHELEGAHELMRRLRDHSAARVVVCSSQCETEDVLSAASAGAVGFLRKDTLTPDALAAATRAAATGSSVMAPDLLGKMLQGLARVSREVLEPRGLSLSRLTSREQRVLSLIADGYPTREVARHLSYSERTVKNVLHDAVIKLNARSRSQAVAFAVREGLI